MSSMQISDYEIVKHSIPSMGGLLEVAITVEPERRAAAADAARRAAQRVEVWASRLTRFSDDSDLSVLNASRDPDVTVRPTLAAALRWAKDAERRSHGVVDATMLDQRLAAESGDEIDSDSIRAWRVAEAAAGRAARVERRSDFRFDLDGVAKGWIADRAADLLRGWPGVAVDADGDISFQADSGVEWFVAVADPRLDDDAEPLATLRLHGGDGWSRSYGVATSGTSVHRWRLSDGRTTHHLIDRRTGLPADTDVIQATVIAPSAREAEMIAKSAVILGARQAYEFLTHSSAHAAILLLDCDDVVALPGIEKWLA
jgi:FAD:protein FMN transferase